MYTYSLKEQHLEHKTLHVEIYFINPLYTTNPRAHRGRSGRAAPSLPSREKSFSELNPLVGFEWSVPFLHLRHFRWKKSDGFHLYLRKHSRKLT